MVLLIKFCCGTPPSCLKVRSGGGCLQRFSVSPRPLGFGFGTKGFGAKGLGPGLDNCFRELLPEIFRELLPENFQGATPQTGKIPFHGATP